MNRACLLSPKTSHIPKYLYGWHMLPSSVTTSADAKPVIIPSSLRVHNEQLGGRKPFVESTWPPFFCKRRIGAFKLQFTGLQRFVDSVALVVVGHGADADPELTARLKQIIPYAVSDVLMLAEDKRPDGMGRQAKSNPRLIRDNKFAESLMRVRSDYVLFLDSSIELAYTSAVDELLGYLLLDRQIGVVAGKVLTREHRICCSSYVFREDLRVFGQGQCDADFDGYWYKNRLTHNALAVPLLPYDENAAAPAVWARWGQVWRVRGAGFLSQASRRRDPDGVQPLGRLRQSGGPPAADKRSCLRSLQKQLRASFRQGSVLPRQLLTTGPWHDLEPGDD